MADGRSKPRVSLTFDDPAVLGMLSDVLHRATGLLDARHAQRVALARQVTEAQIRLERKRREVSHSGRTVEQDQ